MTVFDLNQVPTNVQMQLQGNTGLFGSPLLASAQTVGRAVKWGARYSFNTLKGDDRGDMLGTIAALRSQENRLRVPIFDNPKRGAYGGTPLVDGASQTGFTINLKDASFTITNWIRKGDYFSIDVNGEHELKMAVIDASSDGAGLILVTFEPKLRASPLDNAVVFVEDGVLDKPEGVFLFEDAINGWTSRPGFPDKLTSVALKLIEDVFVTQS